MTRIFTDLKNKYPNIPQIDIFSDGASSQFKQRYLFSNLHPWEQEFDVGLRWHFFATSHGKGVVDVRSGKGKATTPADFYELAVRRNPGIHLSYIEATFIQQNKGLLEERWKDAIPVPNTHKLHFVMPHERCSLLKVKVPITATPSDHIDDDDDNLVEHCGDSTSDEENFDDLDKCKSSSDLDVEDKYQIGDWLVVQCGSAAYPGEITTMVEEEPKLKVKVMHRSGTTEWKWPDKPDEVFYFERNVIQKISPPVPSGKENIQGARSVSDVLFEKFTRVRPTP
ncbi:hypothetical protein ScPMuIL_016162 [Solemya velum]